MRGKAAALIAAGLVVLSLTLMFVVQRAQAEGAPLDDCWNMLGGGACEHVFKDGSKCIVFKGPNPPGHSWASYMECKIK
jgi:hypothetical protein